MVTTHSREENDQNHHIMVQVMKFYIMTLKFYIMTLVIGISRKVFNDRKVVLFQDIRPNHVPQMHHWNGRFASRTTNIFFHKIDFQPKQMDFPVQKIESFKKRSSCFKNGRVVFAPAGCARFPLG